MTVQNIDFHQIIRDRYLRPLQRKRRDYVGIEFEFPIVHFGNRPVDWDIVQDMTRAFMNRFAFSRSRTDDNDRIFDAQNPENGDDLSFDCSFNTLEFSFGAESDMNRLHGRFRNYYAFIEDFLAPYEHTLTGMGINPNWQYNVNEPVANGRYRMLFHHLSSYPKYPEKVCHAHPNFGMFSCASQVQLDVDSETAIPALNTFNRLEPFNALLFANSPFADESGSYLCSRDHLWADSMQGYNPHNVGLYDRTFSSADDVVDYIASESMYCLERDGKYMNFAPIPLKEYFSSDVIPGEFWNGTAKKYQDVSFAPRPEDVAFHRSYKFEDLTFRGTIEFRSCCTQPAGEVMTVAAYFAGLMESLPQLEELLAQDTSLYGHEFTTAQLREMTTRCGIPDFADPGRLSAALLDILRLAENGLKKRGYGEECFLSPLYRRAETLTNPAMLWKQNLSSGQPKEALIRKYAQI